MHLPVKINGNKKIITTNDGSFTFYSLEYSESYKTKSSGAYTESLHKFVNASDIIGKLKKSDVRLLDICFGMGMNLAATIDKALANDIINKLHIVSVEKDAHLLQLVNEIKILFPPAGYETLRNIVKNGSNDNFSLELHINDARTILMQVTGKFDVIYFDPFSKKHNPEMWTDEVYARLYSLLAENGTLVTYASGKTVKERLCAAGFALSETPSIGSRKQPATKATKSKL